MNNSALITFSQKCSHCVTAVMSHVSWGMILYSIKSPQIQNHMCFLRLV